MDAFSLRAQWTLLLLVSVLLGYVILKEKLRPLQWLAVSMALGAVLWLTWINGALPWIGLTIAATFGVYGLLRKIAHLGALEGLALETILLAPLVLTILAITPAVQEDPAPAVQVPHAVIAGSVPVVAQPQPPEEAKPSTCCCQWGAPPSSKSPRPRA